MLRITLTGVLLGVLVGCDSGGAVAPAREDAARPSTASAGEPAEPNDTPTATEGSVTAVRDLSAMGEGPVDPGRYLFAPFGGSGGAPEPVLRVPTGFSAFRGFAVGVGAGPRQGAVGVWRVETVYKQPCDDSVADEVGPTPADFVAAIKRQASTRTTSVGPVRLGGYRGLYAEVRTPRDLDPGDCNDGAFDLWGNYEGATRFTQTPGEVERLWVLDVEGHRVVLASSHGPRASAARVRELTRIVKSVRFQPGQL